MSRFLPFPALVGLEQAQQALLLLAIEPRLRGVVLAAPAGTGKSSLARGIRDVLSVDGSLPFVEVPASVDAENLLGGLDLGATLRTGRIVTQQGVLARAHGGVAYVDGLNLLSDSTTNLLLSVLDEGEVSVEREGVSIREPARFRLVGSYDPAEGLPRAHLLDRVGLLITLPAGLNAAQRERVIGRNLQTENWAEDIAFLRGLVQTAREQLPEVTITEEQIRRLSVTALQYGVEGHRVDLFAMRAACAAAAFNLRDSVTEEDCELAARLVILPRATRLPTPPDSPPPPPPEPPPPDPADDESGEQETTPPDQLAPQPEQILEALESDLPDELDELPFHKLRRGRSGSRGATEGKRGRHVRSIPGDPKRARIDVVATLRAAAPWQHLRGSGERLHLRTSDIRVKRYQSKAGALFCFAVDASGSMALHRMRQAKGAVNALLEKAYVNRDRVALISFRGQQADLMLPPSQSVERARRALDLLPTGGGTPLASALLLAADVAEQAKMRGIMQTVLILLTDGRGNIGLKEESDLQAEIKQMGAYIAEVGLHSIVVDTKRSYLSRGEAAQLAEWLHGDYAYLPNANGEQIADIAAGAVR